MKFVDWFAGIGGIRLGLERAGHECVWSCEIDPFARAVYGARFGHEPEASDIEKVEPSDIPEADLWVGGFPCQDVSSAGKREGLDVGTRSGLVWKLLELAAVKRPRWVLLENVPGLFSVDGGTGFGRLIAELDSLGFLGAWRVLDARFFGVPQRRRRVFILAGRDGEGPHPASILLEPEGVRGRAASSATTGEDLAHAVTARAGKGVSQRDGDGDIILDGVAGTLGGGSGDRGWCDDLDRTGAFIPGVAASVTAAMGRQGSPREDVNDNLIAYQGHGGSVGPMGTLRKGNGNVTGGVPFIVNADASTAKESAGRESDTARCIDSNGSYAAGQGGTVIAFDPTQVTHTENRSRCEPGEPAPTLAAKAHAPTIAFNWRKGSGGAGASEEAASCMGTNHSGHDAVMERRATEEGEAMTTVRRLTPRECERLQGLPDDWTLIPWRPLTGDRRAASKADSPRAKKAASRRDGLAPDGRRYKAIGNSVAVVVLEWIGWRLRAAEREGAKA